MDGFRTTHHAEAWNEGHSSAKRRRSIPGEIWAIRIRLQMQGRTRDLALFDLGIDSKLRACDLVKLRVRDVCHSDRVAWRRSCCSKRPSVRSSSRSRHQLARHWKRGLSQRS